MGLLSRLRRSTPTPASVISAPPSPAPSTERKPSLSDVTDLSIPEESDSDNAALDVVADMLYRSCWPLGWMPFRQVESDQWLEEVMLGVSIRSEGGSVRSCPAEHEGLAEFEAGIGALHANCAIKFTCKAVEYMVRYYLDSRPDLAELCLDANTRIQVIESVSHLGTARKNQYAAFVRDEAVLVVWADAVDELIPAAAKLEKSLISFIWSSDKSGKARPPLFSDNNVVTAEINELAQMELEDPEKAVWMKMRKDRPVVLITPTVVGLAFGVTMVLAGLAIRSLLQRYLYDGDWTRWFLVFTLPVACLLASFPCIVLITAMVYIFGPISHFDKNSFYYSAIRPDRSKAKDLMSITVQLPVYKEDLDEVIKPTVESLKKAITTFERQGGTVNVVVCDDGLQLVSEELRQERIKYYTANNIGYCARPPNGQDGFERRGKFKKAGNLNHTNKISLSIEMWMNHMRPSRYGPKGVDGWSEQNERDLYVEAREIVVEKSRWPVWVEGNVRIGEIILIIDSDTRVPVDCFMDAALEMLESPQVAIIQHSSGVMQVAHHFFENNMAFFTDLIQIGISMAVAGGDVAPFVGHNAFLRWSALQDSAFVDPYDNCKRVWSESHVSEDFQIALNVQSKGWTVRWATYNNNQFEEGVSLTAPDELSRWQKYAWGCSEITFYPMTQWHKHGILTPLFKTFVKCNLNPHSKFSILAYMSSYYAFSSAWLGTIISFVLIGVFVKVDTFYVDAWSVFFICVLLFQGLSNVALCILRYRLGMANAGMLAIRQLFLLPWFFTVFFSGLSLPIATALIAHPLGIDMNWSTTSKSVEKSNFFKQLPKIFKGFWPQMLISVTILGGMIASTSKLMPMEYRVGDLTAIIPITICFGSHFIWPFVLDPFLTTFTY